MMEIANPCCCCLLRPPEKDLFTPYVFLGVTETFSELLEEVFQIHFATGLDNEYGICEVCVGRLRDASDFKVQVQRCQGELQERVVTAWNIKDENLSVESEMDEDIKYVIEEDLMLHTETSVKSEMSDETASEGESTLCEEELEQASCDAREQLAMACSVRLERLDDKLRHTSPGTSPRHPPLPAHSAQAGQLTDTTEQKHFASGLDASPESYTCDSFGEHFARSDILFHLLTRGVDNAYSKQTEGTLGQDSQTDDKSFISSLKVFQESLLTQHIPIHPVDKPFTCGICNMQFKRKSNFTVHNRKHTAQKLYSDRILSKRMYSRSQQHKLSHSDNSPNGDANEKQFTPKSDMPAPIAMDTPKKPDDSLNSCDVCQRQFTRRAHLIEHTRIHTGIKPFKCEHCYQTFRYRSSFWQHKQVHGSVKHACDICNKKFTRKYYLTKHLRKHKAQKPPNIVSKKMVSKSMRAQKKRIHSGKQLYICYICKKQFRGESQLNEHIRFHKEQKPYDCKVCSKKFFTRSNLMRHAYNHTGDQPHVCAICGQQFVRESSLTTHMKNHKPQKSLTVSKLKRTQQKLNHLGDKPHICKTCKKQFRRKIYLVEHTRIHTGVKPYSCEVCSGTFRFYAQFRKHKLTHTDNKPHTCHVCNKQFQRKSNWTVHVRKHTTQKDSSRNISIKKVSKSTLEQQILSGNQPYICYICKKQFQSPSQFSLHMRFHTGQKPYGCNVCNKKFFTESHLAKHKRIHADDKPYTCSVCKHQFSRKFDLTKHIIRKHTAQKSRNVSSKKLISMSNVTRPKKILSNQPYICYICKKRFRCPSHLSVHMRFHTGLRPYECTVCYKKFFTRSSLTRHERIHTGVFSLATNPTFVVYAKNILQVNPITSSTPEFIPD